MLVSSTVAAQRIGAQLRGPPQACAEPPGFDASEATTLDAAGCGPVSCSALLGSISRKLPTEELRTTKPGCAAIGGGSDDRTGPGGRI